jgi:hypothetical protein
LVKFVSTKEINGKIKVIDKDISDFSVDRTKRERLKLDYDKQPSNRRDPRRIDQGHGNRQPRFTNLTSTSFSHIHRNREAISFKICIVQKVYVPKHVSLPKAFIEASNKSNIVIFIALLFVI